MDESPNSTPSVPASQNPSTALSGTVVVDQTARLKPYQFKPGQSGNPGGEQKKLPITTALRRELEK